MSHSSIPTTLAGLQLVCSSPILVGDVLISTINRGNPFDIVTVGDGLNGALSQSDGRTPGGGFRVYRKMDVPHPGDTDIAPSGKTYAEERAEKPLLPHHSTVGVGANACPIGEMSFASSAKEFKAGCAPGPLTTGYGASPVSMPSTAAARKSLPVATGVIDYFPDALLAVAACSKAGNDQHNPGKPLHWDRSKSTDESDSLIRHFIARGTVDTDGIRHSTKVAWRALALLQKEIEAAAK